MTARQISIIQNSWKLLRALDPGTVGDVFYSRLFFTHPALRSMFPEKLDAQHQKLISMLNMVVARLDRLDELSADIAALARRHTGYGVRDEHYPPVLEALLWTLERGLGTDWNAETQEAWRTCLLSLATAMQQAAKTEPVQPANPTFFNPSF